MASGDSSDGLPSGWGDLVEHANLTGHAGQPENSTGEQGPQQQPHTPYRHVISRLVRGSHLGTPPEDDKLQESSDSSGEEGAADITFNYDDRGDIKDESDLFEVEEDGIALPRPDDFPEGETCIRLEPDPLEGLQRRPHATHGCVISYLARVSHPGAPIRH